jgi:hypothetical protein
MYLVRTVYLIYNNYKKLYFTALFALRVLLKYIRF